MRRRRITAWIGRWRRVGAGTKRRLRVNSRACKALGKNGCRRNERHQTAGEKKGILYHGISPWID
jgi:hypothetical protein